MATTNDGGPAFPVLTAQDPTGIYRIPIAEGMSLRDWFAGQALNGLVQSATYGAELMRIFDEYREIANSGEPKETPQHYTARIALSLADEMLKARGEQK